MPEHYSYEFDLVREYLIRLGHDPDIHRVRHRIAEDENGVEYLDIYEWPDGITKPTEEQLDEIRTDLKAAREVKREKIVRQKALSALENPVDLARKLEELTLNITQNKSLPINPQTDKTYIEEWAESHKNAAENIRKS